MCTRPYFFHPRAKRARLPTREKIGTGDEANDTCDQVLSAKSTLSVADKVYELVKGIKNRVKQDKESYLVLVNWLSQGGVLYQPIVNTLTEEYQRQQQVASTVPAILDIQHQQASK